MTTIDAVRATTRAQLEVLLRIAEEVLAADRQTSDVLESRLQDTRRVGEAIGVIMAEYKIGNRAAEGIFAQLATDDEERVVAERILTAQRSARTSPQSAQHLHGSGEHIPQLR